MSRGNECLRPHISALDDRFGDDDRRRRCNGLTPAGVELGRGGDEHTAITGSRGGRSCTRVRRPRGLGWPGAALRSTFSRAASARCAVGGAMIALTSLRTPWMIGSGLLLAARIGTALSLGSTALRPPGALLLWGAILLRTPRLTIGSRGRASRWHCRRTGLALWSRTATATASATTTPPAVPAAALPWRSPTFGQASPRIFGMSGR